MKGLFFGCEGKVGLTVATLQRFVGKFGVFIVVLVVDDFIFGGRSFVVVFFGGAFLARRFLFLDCFGRVRRRRGGDGCLTFGIAHDVYDQVLIKLMFMI